MAQASTKAPKVPTYDMIAGLDIGNGFMKGRIAVADKNWTIDVPSALAYTLNARLEQPIETETLESLENNLDATIVSPALPQDDCGRVIFGSRAVNSGELLTQFQINSHSPKSSESLSLMLALDAVASKAVELAGEGGTLPETILVNCKLAVALPIDDYLGYREEYKRHLLDGPHLVIVHNFAANVEVKVNFVAVAVEAEGVAALDALKSFGAPFMDVALAAERSHGAQIDAAYNGQMLIGAQNVCGIDIGEGTVNFPVFTGGKIDIDSSESINRGIGTVLDSVIGALRKKNSGIPAETRGAIEKIILSEPVMPRQTRIKEAVVREVKTTSHVLVREICNEFSSVWRKVGDSCEVVFVYGGGASILEDMLVPKIREITRAGEDEVPVICLNSAYSRNLNATGLFTAAKNL